MKSSKVSGEGSSWGGLEGGIESSPQKGPPLPLFGGAEERLGEDARKVTGVRGEVETFSRLMILII